MHLQGPPSHTVGGGATRRCLLGNAASNCPKVSCGKTSLLTQSCRKARPALRWPLSATGPEGPSSTTPHVEGEVATPAPEAPGRMTYRPESFEDIVEDAVKAVLAAMKVGENRLEVEFPPLPGSVDDYKGASDAFIDANTQHALTAAQLLCNAGKKVRILVPDTGELERSGSMYKYMLSVSDDLSMGHTNEWKPGVLGALSSFLSGQENNTEAPVKDADIFIMINHSTIELPSIEEFANVQASDKTLILWNLELDTLRADLGLFGFPSKELHFRFLSQFKPAFYLRQRDYAKTIGVAPFVINYSGALFREFPGPWQVMLKQDSGVYACIAEDACRYNLGEAKEELMAAMGLNTEEKGSAMEFLRRGYKRSTWWEDGKDKEQSRAWRT